MYYLHVEKMAPRFVKSSTIISRQIHQFLFVNSRIDAALVADATGFSRKLLEFESSNGTLDAADVAPGYQVGCIEGQFRIVW